MQKTYFHYHTKQCIVKMSMTLLPNAHVYSPQYTFITYERTHSPNHSDIERARCTRYLSSGAIGDVVATRLDSRDKFAFHKERKKNNLLAIAQQQRRSTKRTYTTQNQPYTTYSIRLINSRFVCREIAYRI